MISALKGPDIEVARPKGMKDKHNALVRWSALFDRDALDRLKGSKK